MTPREAAIVAAYTGVKLGKARDAQEYASELFDRPVQLVEFSRPEFTQALRERSRGDFFNLISDDTHTVLSVSGADCMTNDQFREQVWANLDRMLQADPGLRLADIAERVGRSPVTLQKFRNRTRMSVPVASLLVRAIPQLADGMRCAACGRMPDIVFS